MLICDSLKLWIKNHLWLWVIKLVNKPGKASKGWRIEARTLCSASNKIRLMVLPPVSRHPRHRPQRCFAVEDPVSLETNHWSSARVLQQLMSQSVSKYITKNLGCFFRVLHMFHYCCFCVKTFYITHIALLPFYWAFITWSSKLMWTYLVQPWHVIQLGSSESWKNDISEIHPSI